jgi:hypothetical protein
VFYLTKHIPKADLVITSIKVKKRRKIVLLCKGNSNKKFLETCIMDFHLHEIDITKNVHSKNKKEKHF